jgi:prepilin-type N-terminal cleavage/methylation domain-containing protein
MNSEQLFHKALKLDKQLIILRTAICEERSARTDVRKTKSEVRSAFTLLELLLVIAVVAILAGIVLFALNPAGRLQEANDTKAIAKSNDLKKAIQAYVVDNGGSLPANISSLTTYGIYDVCKQGQSTNCVNLDVLVTNGYMSEIPVDSEGETTVISGYKIEYDPTKTTVNTYSTDTLTEYVEGGATLTKGLVGWWKMDENTGTTAADSSGNGNTGTLIASFWQTGKYGSSLNALTTGTYADIAQVSVLNPVIPEMTITSWIYVTAYNDPALNQYQTVIEGSGNLNNANGYYLGFNGFGSVFRWSVGNGTSYDAQVLIPETDIPLNQWVQVVGVINSSNAYVYVNGILRGSDTHAMTNIAYGVYPIRIGRLSYTNGTTHALNGYIDDVRIYNRALNQDEVSALYNYAPPTIAHWRLDETTGTIATDSSGNGNNGTLTNGPLWVGGRFGNGLSFDGINDWVVINDSNSLDLTNNLTILSWVRPNLLDSTRQDILTKTSAYEFTIHTDNTFRSKFFGLTDDFVSGSSQSLVAGIWYHLATTYDGANIRTYINGNLELTDDSSGNTTITATNLFVGTNSVANTTPYEGLIDEIRIYNYSLTQSQIQKVMNNEI